MGRAWSQQLTVNEVGDPFKEEALFEFEVVEEIFLGESEDVGLLGFWREEGSLHLDGELGIDGFVFVAVDEIGPFKGG